MGNLCRAVQMHTEIDWGLKRGGGVPTCEEFIQGDTERPYVHFLVACGDGVWVQEALAHQLYRG